MANFALIFLIFPAYMFVFVFDLNLTSTSTCKIVNKIHSDVDYSLSPPPRSSARTAWARSSAPSTPAATDPAPAPADWPMDTS